MAAMHRYVRLCTHCIEHVSISVSSIKILFSLLLRKYWRNVSVLMFSLQSPRYSLSVLHSSVCQPRARTLWCGTRPVPDPGEVLSLWPASLRSAAGSCVPFVRRGCCLSGVDVGFHQMLLLHLLWWSRGLWCSGVHVPRAVLLFISLSSLPELTAS